MMHPTTNKEQIEEELNGDRQGRVGEERRGRGPLGRSWAAGSRNSDRQGRVGEERRGRGPLGRSWAAGSRHGRVRGRRRLEGRRIRLAVWSQMAAALGREGRGGGWELAPRTGTGRGGGVASSGRRAPLGGEAGDR